MNAGRKPAAVHWRRLRLGRASKEFQTAYAERRLELEVAAKIHAFRRKRGLSQQQLARLLGTQQSAIARLEGGGENISLSRLQKIASLLRAQVKIELKTVA